MSFATIKPAIALFLFTAVAAVIVGFMHNLTALPIERQILAREQAAINEIIPNSLPLESNNELDLPGSTVWRWDSRQNEQGELLGYVFFARSRGYDGFVYPLESNNELDLPDSTVWRWDSRQNEQGELLGYVFFARSRGYDGFVYMLVGFNVAGDILGIRIISHTETPGLGTVIAGEAFANQFIGLRGPVESVRNPQGLHQIDIQTGATLSVNAVLRAVNDAWEVFQWLRQ